MGVENVWFLLAFLKYLGHVTGDVHALSLVVEVPSARR